MSKYKDLLPLRDQILYELGRCVMNLQTVERLIKNILLAARLTNHPKHGPKRKELISNATLGGLKTELFESFLLESAPRSEPDSDDPPFTIRMSHSHVLPADVRTNIQSELDQLTAARNQLIHNFHAKYDLACEGCCEGALTHLKDLNDRASLMIGTLNETRQDQLKMMSDMREFMQSTTWLNVMLGKPIPPGEDWLMIEEVTFLIEALALYGDDGKLALDAGVQHLVRKGCPQDAYQNYGCQSWQDLVSKTGLLCIEKQKNTETGQWERFYRSSSKNEH